MTKTEGKSMPTTGNSKNKGPESEKSLRNLLEEQWGWRRDQDRDQEVEIYEKRGRTGKHGTDDTNYFLLSKKHPC